MPPDEIKLPADRSAFDVYDPNAGDATEPRKLLPAPPWRKFDKKVEYDYVCTPETARLVNVALLLRRPLLVTGNPGTGKSSLAYSIARKLGYKSVLRWNITSRSSLKDGLYNYDVIQRLNDASLFRSLTEAKKPVDKSLKPELIQRYITLGPLGTALLPSDHPRVLLIDELDKADIDLPNDLLHVFEEGQYRITELQQAAMEEDGRVDVRSVDVDLKPRVSQTVTCSEFPVVVLTSNAEREFSPAFLRRCIRLNLDPPKNEAQVKAELLEIAKSHLKDLLNEVDVPVRDKIIDAFIANRANGIVANDQLMNALYLVAGVRSTDPLKEEPVGHLQAVDSITGSLTRSR